MKQSKRLKVILYARVSTEEQANYGYSLRAQKQQLENWCKSHGAQIVRYFQEDGASAKSFKRPEFQKLLDFIKTNKGLADTLLVVKWDRFSRGGLRDAVPMQIELARYGIHVRTVEQGGDTSSPEDEVMQAINIVFAKLENDRRAMSTRAGMIRALREGRWMGRPPIGYSIRPNGEKSKIAPNSDRELVQNIFRTVATSTKALALIRKDFLKQGLKCSKSNFYRLLTNVLYIGKVRVPAYLNDPEEIVQGQHEAIIEESLFEAVTLRLSGKGKRSGPSKAIPNLTFPLRGNLICKLCGKNLTGSIAKGRYPYYHCQLGCKERFSVSKANAALSSLFASIRISPEVKELYQLVLKDIFARDTIERRKKISELEKEIIKQEESLLRTDEMFLEKKIERDSYNRLKQSYSSKLSGLNSNIQVLREGERLKMDNVVSGFNLLTNPQIYYDSGSHEIKQRIISSIFPAKLVFEDEKYRTPRENTVLSLISIKNNKLRTTKNKKLLKTQELSHLVTPTGLEPVQPP